ncbi:hypothetical protein Dda_6723 [Drechslerella dactyloides]|uniref:F-box domain-containing protein n=1 Tax=Drechslerella dactyloides TaxID=74499 RepID=A0AAD6IW42_DREDA|nr:hypothetical protein Dda_6723 [Drechslerella dactyloides]
MAKPKKKTGRSALHAASAVPSAKQTAVVVTPSVKSEDTTSDNGAMALDDGYTNPPIINTTAVQSSERPADAHIKPESRTVSPSPPSPRTTIHYRKLDFDGALMQEDPEFNEDFIPAEGEEIDLTSLAVPAPALPEGEAGAASAVSKRGMDDDDGFDDATPVTKRRRLDDAADAELTTSATTANASTGTVSTGTSTATATCSVDRLPAAIWTEILTYVGLPGIGRLRGVCRRFSEMLEKEYIWRRCRKIHCPDMPKPAFGVKEWDMWRLVRGRGCMKCERFPGRMRGEDGLKVYWQFRVRCCEGCFRRNVVKDAELYRCADDKVTPTIMKELVLALAYGLVDGNFMWVPTTMPVLMPDVEKVYWSEDIAEIKARYDEALQMDAAEEWLKGLEGEGFAHKADADRMEKWEVRVMQGNSYNPAAGTVIRIKSTDKIGQQTGSSKASNGIPVLISSDNPPFQPQSIPTFYQRTRQYGDRSHQELEEMKARRKADIEGRCLKLNPPLMPEVLAHCAAFQAALKATQPLTEQTWPALQAKILEQRAGAEEYERVRQLQRRQLEQQLEDRKLLESQERDQWVKKERQWEETQAPVREMISRLADDEISGWLGKVTFESAPAFAASILIAVRTRYYELGGVPETSPASDSVLAAAAPPSSSTSPPPTTPISSTAASTSAPGTTAAAAATGKPRQLVLENMKYLFDNKIKPITDPCRRELFFCKACKEIAANPALAVAAGVTIPPPPKLYGFEGVIQHYAAKHTTDMSLGTVVVHWRSLWPEDAPFVVDPNEIKRLMTKPFGPAHAHPHQMMAGGAGGGGGGGMNVNMNAGAMQQQVPGNVLIRTNGPPVPTFGYPPHQHQHQHQHQHHQNHQNHQNHHAHHQQPQPQPQPQAHQSHRHPHHLHHGQGPTAGPQTLPGPAPYGRTVPAHRQPYHQVEAPPPQHHHAGYHHQAPPLPHHNAHHSLPPHQPPPQQIHVPQPHPHHGGHQPYQQGPMPAPMNDRSHMYPNVPQAGYPPPQPTYHHQQQPQQQQQPLAQPPHQQYPYQSTYPQAPVQTQSQYNAYGQHVPAPRPAPANAYPGPHQPVPAAPQPDPYEEAAKKEAEAAAAAEKERKEKIQFIANYAEQIWKNMGGNKALEASIRALLMIHETCAAFAEKYNPEDMSIHLFHQAIRAEIDGPLKFMKLGNSKFECRSCPKTSTRSFTLPLLFQHFSSVHVARPNLGPSATGQGVKPKRFDWLVDMIRLPEEEEVQKMVSRQGFDRRRMAAVEKVYPGVFDKKTEIVAQPVETVKKHASKASMSAAEDFLNNLLPAAPVEQQQVGKSAPEIKKEPGLSEPPDFRDNDKSSTPATIATSRTAAQPHQSRPRSPSLSPTPSVDSRRSRSRRRDSYGEYYRRPLTRDSYADDDREYRRYPDDDNAYYPRPVRRAASPYQYDRYPSPRRYRAYRPIHDDYELPPRERYSPPPPPPQPSRPIRAEPSPSTSIPPPAGGLEYDDPPQPLVSVSGHTRERYPEELDYRRPPPPAGYPPHTEYYDRVIDRDPHPRSYPPPPPGSYHYDRAPPPPPRYYDDPYVRHPYYYGEYEYRERPPPPPPPQAVRVYRDEYDRYYDRERGRDVGREREFAYARPPPGHIREEEYDRGRGRGRSRSPDVGREWNDRERRGYMPTPPGAAGREREREREREWRDEGRGRGRSGSSGGGYRGRAPGGRGGA